MDERWANCHYCTDAIEIPATFIVTDCPDDTDDDSYTIPAIPKSRETNSNGIPIARRVKDEEGPCPRCGGDHSWCGQVRDDEYGYMEHRD